MGTTASAFFEGTGANSNEVAALASLFSKNFNIDNLIDGRGNPAGTVTPTPKSDYIILGPGDALNEDKRYAGNKDFLETGEDYTISGAVRAVKLTGDADASVFGSNEAEAILGNGGNNELDGGGGDDVLVALAGQDTLLGGSGNDQLFGGDDNDEARGGHGNDTVVGGDGDDELFGDAGNDLLLGDDGLDTLFGGDGHDTLVGGVGSDSLVGGVGADTYRGGDDNDFFDIGTAQDARGDTIEDFRQGDMIDITDMGLAKATTSVAVKSNGDSHEVSIVQGKKVIATFTVIGDTPDKDDFVF